MWRICQRHQSMFLLMLFSRPQSLAAYASVNLEAMNPPLFLRYLNLLMNDAIFLLDEAIQVKWGTKCCTISMAYHCMIKSDFLNTQLI